MSARSPDTSTCSPRAIAGHACACAGVGAAKAWANHVRTWGLKLDNGTPTRLPRVFCDPPGGPLPYCFAAGPEG